MFIAKWLFGANLEILHYSYVFEGHQKFYKPKSIYAKHMSTFFYCQKYDIISQ